jgi:hypothetical protein
MSFSAFELHYTIAILVLAISFVLHCGPFIFVLFTDWATTLASWQVYLLPG